MNLGKHEMLCVLLGAAFFITAGLSGVYVCLSIQLQRREQVQIEATKELTQYIALSFNGKNESVLMDLKQHDPWGTFFKIKLDGSALRHCEVISAGPDKIFGTDDDIYAGCAVWIGQ